MNQEQRIRDLERAVAMLISAQAEDEPQHFYHAEQGGPIRLVFSRRYDGGIDVSFEPC